MLMCMESELCSGWLQCIVAILSVAGGSVLPICRTVECMSSAGSVWHVGVQVNYCC